jgi:predicted Zn-dependent protease with MMP-like domain
MGGEVSQRMANSPLPVRAPRRDRHGRGLRGRLAPSHLPISRSRSERFDDLVLDAVDRLESRWGTQLDGVEFAVEEVPPPDAAVWSADLVPLARLFPVIGELPARIVLYRRPLEARATGREELRSIVHDVVVEEIAELLGLEPEMVDPRYGNSAE